jgi:uncharacterized protein involved in exopolysaccharide biosynthesis
MSKRDVILFLFKWKYSLIGYFLFVVASVTALVYVLPQKYEAMSAVLVESNRAPVMRSDTAFGTKELTALNSAIAIIQSETVLSAAVDKVGIGESGEAPSTVELLIDDVVSWLEGVGLKEPMTPRDELIETLRDNLEAEPLAESNVITITLGGKNPKWITDIVNAVTDSYIAQHLRIFSSKGTSEVYRIQVERLANDLEDQRKKLAEYKRSASVSALNETRHALVLRQSELTSEMARAREELAELQTRFSPGHSKVRLAEEKVAAIQKSLADTQPKLRNLEVQEAAIEEMELGITSVEKSYQEYQARYEEARLNDLANPEVVNVRVIEYASAPTRAAHSRIFYVVLAVLGGAMLSVGIALIREYFDHRVDDLDEVSHLLGFPSLGSVERARMVF